METGGLPDTAVLPATDGEAADMPSGTSVLASAGGCIHAIGSPLRRSERGGGSRLETGHIRAPELIQEKEK